MPSASIQNRTDRRIALFLQDLHGGGAERVMLLLAGGIARRGYPVDLVLVRREGAHAGSIPSEIRVVELGTRRVLGSVPALVRYLRRERPSALLTALVHVNVGGLLAAAATRGIRVVVTEHNQISRNFASLTSRRLRSAYRLVPMMYRRAWGIVAVSGGVADDLAAFSGIGRDRIYVINNPIVTPDIEARAAEPLDHPWIGPQAPPLFLGVGRLTPQKDFPALVAAFALVRAGRRCRLAILGDGPERVAIEAEADRRGVRDDVLLPGFVDNPYAWMARASVFVLSSRFEGLPTVLVEALACGTTVVATDCPSGPREILENGRYGALVPAGDPEALAAAMRDALDRPRPRELLVRRAADYGLDAAVDRYLQLLDETMICVGAS
ncbi:glycosyltransferase [Arenibaculum sp.]|jgi:glycosyltransferase involved in cell wall biosynthesis|uniref:glycosyltransferase n=1 Tax=Arenibaculum sp. TaxID=2865862 RepID=UPI002E138D9B|nr:glycosyltransferase [Arenibaculum sp.]